jgi:hypothetical protein
MKNHKAIVVAMALGTVLFSSVVAFSGNAFGTEAWSMDSMGCTVFQYEGTLDGAHHASDSAGGYTRVSSTDANSTVWLTCPVWLPHATKLNALKIKGSRASSSTSIVAYFYGHPSIQDGTGYDLIQDCTFGDYSGSVKVETCGFENSITICNYQDTTDECDETSEVLTYYILVKIMKSGNYYAKLYNLWLGEETDGKMQSSAYDPDFPIDCTIVIEDYLAGYAVTEEERGCFMFEDMSWLW